MTLKLNDPQGSATACRKANRFGWGILPRLLLLQAVTALQEADKDLRRALSAECRTENGCAVRLVSNWYGAKYSYCSVVIPDRLLRR